MLGRELHNWHLRGCVRKKVRVRTADKQTNKLDVLAKLERQEKRLPGVPGTLTAVFISMPSALTHEVELKSQCLYIFPLQKWPFH